MPASFGFTAKNRVGALPASTDQTPPSPLSAPYTFMTRWPSGRRINVACPRRHTNRDWFLLPHRYREWLTRQRIGWLRRTLHPHQHASTQDQHPQQKLDSYLPFNCLDTLPLAPSVDSFPQQRHAPLPAALVERARMVLSSPLRKLPGPCHAHYLEVACAPLDERFPVDFDRQLRVLPKLRVHRARGHSIENVSCRALG